MVENKELELSVEEVEVYFSDCGEARYECLHDCFGGTALLSPNN